MDHNDILRTMLFSVDLPALPTKILKTNSALYQCPHQIGPTKQALSILDCNVVKIFIASWPDQQTAVQTLPKHGETQFHFIR